MKGLKMIATGRGLPSNAVTNHDMAQIVDTSDEWITTRTGIKQRYFCKGETNAQLATTAARNAMDKAGITPDQIGVCIVATVTPDYAAPTMGCLIQGELGLPEDTPCFDINVGCTGFVYGLSVIRGMLAQSSRPYGLLIGSEVLSRIVNFAERSTCVLFGDGAGAALVALEENALWQCVLGTHCNQEAIMVDGPGETRTFLHMDGQTVFRFAIEAVPKCVTQLLDGAGLTLDDIDWFIPHQANGRIIESAAKRLGVPLARFYQNMERYGNTSAASIPIALDEMSRDGLLKKGQKIICVGFGAGLTWGGVLLEW